MGMLYLINIAVFVGFLYLSWKKPGLALLLVLFTAAGMVFSALVYFEGEVVEEGIGIYVLALLLIPVSISIIYWSPSSGQLETPWYKTIANVLLTLFKYILILALFTLVFQFLSPILFVLFLAAVYQFSMAQKYGLVMDIISAVGASMSQSLPLPAALSAAAQGQSKKQARVFNDIAHWLTQGWPLSEALRRGYPKCPSEMLASIVIAEKMNQLPQAVESLQADLYEKINDYKIVKPVHPWYPLAVLVILFSIMMGLSVFIVPTFAEVLSDVSDGQASLPASTQALLDISSWLLGRHGLNALIIFLLGYWLIAFIMYFRFRKRDPENPRFLSTVGDRVKWRLPAVHWFEKTFGNLHLARIMRVGLTAGYPINTVLQNALRLDVNVCYQNALRKWLKKIENGDNIAHSARTCGLDKTLAWAFDDRINQNNTPQILEGLEEIYRCRYNYYRNVLASVSWPLVILSLGLIVGFVVYAMFMGAFSVLFVTLQGIIPQ